MTDIRFEARLARVVREYADTGLLPIDAVAIAEASVLAGRRDERRWALPPLPRAWALIALAALIAAILAASFIVGGVGVVSAAVGTGILVASSSKRTAASGFDVVPLIGATRGGFRLVGRF